MRVVLAGGGSAGHIEPALALADALRQADQRAEIVCLGTERGLESRLIPMRGYQLAMIPAVPLPRSITPALMAVPGRLAGAVNAAAKVLDRAGADVLVGFGGYVATPGYLAARRRHIPIVVHEANPRPGLANKLGARLTTHVFTGHPGTQLPHARYLGIPIRREIAELDRLALGDKARAHFGLRPDLPVLLVTGGSQGARSLNRAIFGSVGWLRGAGVQVLHVIGPRNAAEVPTFASGAPYVAVPYVDRMDLAYAAADFALCRAGAMTCAELTAVGLPGAFVPLPHGNGEQRLNADPVVAGGGGLLVDDAELTPEWVRDVLLPVLLDIDRVATMSEAAAALGRADADRWLASEVIDVIRATAQQAAGPARPARETEADPRRAAPAAFETDPRRGAPAGFDPDPRRGGPADFEVDPRRAAPAGYEGDPRRGGPAGFEPDSRRGAPPGYDPDPRRAAPAGYEGDPRRGAPSAFESDPRRGAPPGYEADPRRGAPAGPRFTPAPGYGADPGDGAPAGFEPDPRSGPPPGFEPDPRSGPPPGFEPDPRSGPPPGFEPTPRPEGDPRYAEPPYEESRRPEPRRGEPRHGGGPPRRGQPRHGQPRHGG
jgi:UDP-N-acetylglucosamine--N-acetylmuramyl-(pentapeptide) pyrophosphoryl-undecaprenol N-acetylglucosamine transferase